MVIGILYFGEGDLPFHYLIFCALAALGAVQFVAAQARLVGLLLLPAPASRWLGAALVAGAFAWFFTIQPDLFIPGLAGGELFTLFLLGFVIAVLLSMVLGIVTSRLFAGRSFRPPRQRETVPLRGGGAGELWLPHGPPTVLLLALRESDQDSLERLCGELVAGGAAALVCDEPAGEAAVAWLAEQPERFHSLRRHVMGIGRGADRALALFEQGGFTSALALAPFGRAAHARAGLRWLRETDYLAALRATWHSRALVSAAPTAAARVIYGDEDMLIRPSAAREMFPAAIFVAGARHFNLAAMPAVTRLAADFFQVRANAPPAGRQAPAPARGEAGE